MKGSPAPILCAPEGATRQMEHTRWTGKRRAIVIATLTLACVAFLWMAAPVLVSSTELGSNWQCSKTAFVLTTCTKLVSHSLGQPGNPHRFDRRDAPVPLISPIA
jgi:hypothetical protein